MPDQTILGKRIEGSKTLHDEAMRALSVMRSGIYSETRYDFASTTPKTDLSTLTPETVDGDSPDKIFQKDSDIKRSHITIVRFDKDIIVRFNDGDPIEGFVADGGFIQEEVLEVIKIEVTIPSNNTIVRVRLS